MSGAPTAEGATAGTPGARDHRPAAGTGSAEPRSGQPEAGSRTPDDLAGTDAERAAAADAPTDATAADGSADSDAPVPAAGGPATAASAGILAATDGRDGGADPEATRGDPAATGRAGRDQPTDSATIRRSEAAGDRRTDAPADPRTGSATVTQPDPEQQLSSYTWQFHPETLRELVEEPDELRAIRDRLTEKVGPATDNATRARLLSLRAVVSRILGDLDKAVADGRLALAHAEATGELRRIAIAQARLAHVHQWRGEFAEADRLFELANSPELPDRLRVTMHEHAGRSCYDQGRVMEACNHFDKALELRRVEDPDLIARTELALDAVLRKVRVDGLGPYPRTREELLQIRRPPEPVFDERAQRWGYVAADGAQVVAPAYAEVQPFHEEVAWVRRPEERLWELIDTGGATLIDASARLVAVRSFSDGLAWVARAGTGVWLAIDKTNRVVISTGFDDVRPFRRGLAAVRRGGWGAVDKRGRAVIPMRFAGFATALADGRYVEGFTDEGLAVIDTGNGKGVVDRQGRMLVQPIHPALVIHPVAFLVAGRGGRWGALDRRGEPLIDPVHPSRAAVVDEIDRLLADTKPVL